MNPHGQDRQNQNQNQSQNIGSPELNLKFTSAELTSPNSKSLPDIAKTPVENLYAGELNWVGMEKILLPIQVRDSSGEIFKTEANVSAFVNLISPAAKGIHMSRLYALIQEGFEKNLFSVKLLQQICASFLRSHEGLSDLARIEVNFSAMVHRKALVTDHKAWRTYPVSYKLETSASQAHLILSTEILYSSTCPASAALSRRLIQDNFQAQNSDQAGLFSQEQVLEFLGSPAGIVATPHAQRSCAQVEVKLDLETSAHWNHNQLIDVVETALKTPVQTIVKRADEQEFARLNAANLMFCEDAARRIQNELGAFAELVAFSGKVSHEESLHPHNAVAYFKKGKSNV